MTRKKTVIDKFKAAKPILFKNFPIKELAFFGSTSRSEDNESSDIDIMVEFYQPVGMEFIHLCYELERILNLKVDLVSRKGIKERYFDQIKNDLIYV